MTIRQRDYLITLRNNFPKTSIFSLLFVGGEDSETWGSLFHFCSNDPKFYDSIHDSEKNEIFFLLLSKRQVFFFFFFFLKRVYFLRACTENCINVCTVNCRRFPAFSQRAQLDASRTNALHCAIGPDWRGAKCGTQMTPPSVCT